MLDEKVLIERLEEERQGSPCRNTQCEDCIYTNRCYAGELCYEVGMDNVIAIVNQLAEESNLTPCYLGSPCDYQNEDAKMPMEYWDNGWIPCSERLPEFRQWVFATVNLHEKKYEVVMSSYENEEYWHDGTFIAWMPLPAPYQPNKKGED